MLVLNSNRSKFDGAPILNGHLDHWSICVLSGHTLK